MKFVVNGIIRSPTGISKGSLHGHISSESLLLPFTSFMVLKPIKDVLAFDLAVLPQPSWDPLNLFSTWGPNSIVVVKVLQYSYLVSCGSPACTALPAQKTAFAAAAIFVWLLLVLLLLLLELLLRFHDRMKQEENKGKKTKFQERERER